VVTRSGTSRTNGQKIKLFFAANSSFTSLNDTFATVANKATNTYELQGLNTTGLSAFTVGDSSYSVDALLFELMDESNTRFIANPTSYPTKYTYFNDSLVTSWLTGTVDVVVGGVTKTYTTSISVDRLKTLDWPNQKALADANGLQLVQYEGGSHFVGDAFLSGFSGNTQFTEYLLGTGHTEATARVYRAMYDAFIEMGGSLPSKFTETGLDSKFGTWAGFLYLPGDPNPVWRETKLFNERKRRVSLVASP
jgi:hypothetical protein